MSDSMELAGTDRAHIKNWLRRRLTDTRAEQEWPRLVNAAWQQLLQESWVELFPQAATESALDAFLNPDLAASFSRALLNPILRHAFLTLRADQSSLSEWTSEEAFEALERLVSAPKFVRAEWIEAFFKEKAVEDVLSDSLYQALRDFSTLIPRLVLRNLPSGRFRALGMAGNLTEKLAAQLEKVIEPEIRAFLAAGSQKAIQRACNFTIEQVDSETSIQLRRNLLRFAAENSPAFHLSGISKDDCEKLLAANVAQFRDAAQNLKLRSLLFEPLSKVYADHDFGTVADLLGDFADLLNVRLEIWSELTWPAVQSVLQAEDIGAWLDTLVDELLDEYEGSPLVD